MPPRLTRRETLAAGVAFAATSHRHGRHLRRHRPRHAAPRAEDLRRIEHVVILIQENRSFDSYFGTLYGVRGFSDPAAMKLSNGRPVFYQPWAASPQGYLLPWHMDPRTYSPCDLIVDNSWKPSHDSWDGGRMDGFVGPTGPDCMSYYTRADVPWHAALADAFTICDAHHCSALGPTNPNRLYVMSGTIDPGGDHGGPVTDNSEKPPYTWTTYPERLQAAGISWRVYQQKDNFDDNALAWFAQYQQAPPSSPLYQNGIMPRDAGAFARDVAAGALPQVSWIIAPTGESEHPGYAPGPGADFCMAMLGALFDHPQVWAKTLFILTYDEHGGYFDHVPPPTAPAGTRDEYVSGLPIGLGFRVPTVICSPWSRGGYVCSHTFDHTSLIRLLERRFGVMEPNISAWRRSVCGDLTACLDFSATDTSIPDLPSTAPLAAQSSAACHDNPAPVPPLAMQRMPGQEQGTRPRRG